MATPSFALVQILRETADRLAGGAEYQWSHFGKCNCGHLAQTATRISARDIHRTAHRKLSEWSEIPDDFCPQTGVLIDRVIDTLFELGLTNTDLRHLEDLTDPEVLARLPGGWRYLQRNQRDDVIVYLRTWADQLEERVAGAECSPEEATDQSPGLTLGRRPLPDPGLKGREKASLSFLPPLQG